MNAQPRIVGFKTILALAKQNRLVLNIGLMATLMPLGFLVLIFTISSSFDIEAPKVDYEEIDRNGTATKAVIKRIYVQTNITINEQNPSIVSYQYLQNDFMIDAKYGFLDSEKMRRMNVGDTIEVKFLGDSSIISGIEPYKFPIGLFTIPLSIFFFVGVIFLMILFFRLKSGIALYKTGLVRDAELVSISPKYRGFLSMPVGLSVYYQYKSLRGNTLLGESSVSDISLMTSWKQGEIIKIFVSVENELKSCVIPKLEQVRNNWKIE